MHFIPSLKIAASATVMALLAACGGGGGTSGTLPQDLPGFVQPAWASPALLVPAGQSSKAHSLTDCTQVISENEFASEASGTEQALGAVSIGGDPLYTVTLTITSAGALSLSGATATTGSIGPLLTYSIGGAQERFRSAKISAANGGVSEINFSANGNDYGANQYSLSQAPEGLNLEVVTFNSNGNRTITCRNSSTQTFALGIPPSDARSKAVFVAAGETSRLSWRSGDDGMAIMNGGSVLNLDQATGVLSLSDSTATTATLRPLSISGAEYFGVAGSTSRYVEDWSLLSEGDAPLFETRLVQFRANVPGQGTSSPPPVLNLTVTLCSSIGPVRNCILGD
jgi:hypothetical protein